MILCKACGGLITDPSSDATKCKECVAEDEPTPIR